MYTKEFCGKNKISSFYIYSEKFIFFERVFGGPQNGSSMASLRKPLFHFWNLYFKNVWLH